MLRLDDAWVWDSWIADDGERYHLFFLRAPRSLEPGLRHANATVGRASSTDLVHWEDHGVVFGPGEHGRFDDLAIWTGSVVRAADEWRMFYTAVSNRGHHLFDQRVGSATSTDLQHWTRDADGPATVVDPRWYKNLDRFPAVTEGPDKVRSSETWRDPLVFADPDGQGWHMLITARSIEAGRNDDGVIAHAHSDDLQTWELGPPLCEPGAGFGQLEVLQNKIIDGRGVLVFTCHPREMTDERIAEFGEYCTWSVPSPGLLGPWDMTRARPFTPVPDLFAAPLVQQRDGSWCLIGFQNLEPKGGDGFHIDDPIPVTLDADGYLVAV